MRTRRTLLKGAILFGSIALALAGWVVYLRPVNDRWIRELAVHLEDKGVSTATRLSAYTPFTWSEVYIFGCYTPVSVVEKAIGSPAPDTLSVQHSDGVNLIVFRVGPKEFRFYEIRRSLLDFDLNGRVLVGQPATAEFVAETNGNDGAPRVSLNGFHETQGK